MKLQIAKTVAHQRLAPNLWQTTFALPRAWATVHPAQFVMLRPLNATLPLLPRPLGIYQTHFTARTKHFSVVYKVAGPGTRNLCELNPGAAVRVLGPLGKPFTPNPGADLWLAAGGLGVVPMFLAAKAYRRARGKYVQLFYGARTQKELVLLKDLKTVCHAVHTIAEQDGKRRGLVTDLLDAALENHAGAPPQLFVCGPGSLLRAAALWALPRRLTAFVSLETPMACGLGACRGCTVTRANGSYASACQDGPVFDAAELDWSDP